MQGQSLEEGRNVGVSKNWCHCPLQFSYIHTACLDINGQLLHSQITPLSTFNLYLLACHLLQNVQNREPPEVLPWQPEQRQGHSNWRDITQVVVDIQSFVTSLTVNTTSTVDSTKVLCPETCVQENRKTRRSYVPLCRHMTIVQPTPAVSMNIIDKITIYSNM